MPTRASWMLFAACLMCACAPAFGADPTPASKRAFMALPTIYVSFELTQTGSKDFSAPRDSLTDGAYRINKHLKFEVPMNMQLPGSCPTSLPMEEAMEEGRCMGWTAMPPDDPALAEKLTTGKLDLSTNPMFVTGEYSVDDVTHFRFRDAPSQGFATQTTTSKGKGLAYGRRMGMVLCDFKKMTCDVANVSFEASDGDQVTTTTSSDVPGFVPKEEKGDPRLMLPQVPQEAASKLMGLPFTPSGPSTSTFSVPGKFQNAAGPDIVIKVSISSKPAGKTGASAK